MVRPWTEKEGRVFCNIGIRTKNIFPTVKSAMPLLFDTLVYSWLDPLLGFGPSITLVLAAKSEFECRLLFSFSGDVCCARKPLWACSKIQCRGGSRIFFWRGYTRLLLFFNTNKPHSYFFWQNTSCIRKMQVISGGGGAPPAPSP